MNLIRPFRALRPPPEFAAQVAAPPYDVLNGAEARRRAAANQSNFLHISRAEVDLAEDIDPYDSVVYQRAAGNFQRLIARGVLRRDDTGGYYAYRLESNEHRQTGLVCVVSLQAYQNQRVKGHELTRPEQVEDRARHILALRAHTGPALLMYPESTEIDRIIAAAASGVPDTTVTTEHGVRHSIWPIIADDLVNALTAAFESLPALYIADGHHRCAAAAHVAIQQRAGSRGDRLEGWNGFLGVAFPHHELRILGYNRLVQSLNGLNEREFLARVNEKFDIVQTAGPVQPTARGEIGLYLPGRWFRLTFNALDLTKERSADPLGANILSDQVFRPLLSITDLRNDRRIEFLGGDRDLVELESRVASGMAAGFVLYPASVEDVITVASRGDIMAPKSTWFEPKLADGLVSYQCDLA
jgi:uncharacterized protein (DUF1015 family)